MGIFSIQSTFLSFLILIDFIDLHEQIVVLGDCTYSALDGATTGFCNIKEVKILTQTIIFSVILTMSFSNLAPMQSYVQD